MYNCPGASAREFSNTCKYHRISTLPTEQLNLTSAIQSKQYNIAPLGKSLSSELRTLNCVLERLINLSMKCSANRLESSEMPRSQPQGLARTCGFLPLHRHHREVTQLRCHGQRGVGGVLVSTWRLGRSSKPRFSPPPPPLHLRRSRLIRDANIEAQAGRSL